jgi:hypothetical protein
VPVSGAGLSSENSIKSSESHRNREPPNAWPILKLSHRNRSLSAFVAASHWTSGSTPVARSCKGRDSSRLSSFVGNAKALDAATARQGARPWLQGSVSEHRAPKLHCTQREVRIEAFVEQALREKLRREGR